MTGGMVATVATKDLPIIHVGSYDAGLATMAGPVEGASELAWPSKGKPSRGHATVVFLCPACALRSLGP